MSSQDFYKSILDSMTEHVVIVDPYGVIEYVNSAWVRFGEENQARVADGWPGINYLAACDAAASMGDRSAEQAGVGIRELHQGKNRHF